MRAKRVFVFICLFMYVFIQNGIKHKASRVCVVYAYTFTHSLFHPIVVSHWKKVYLVNIKQQMFCINVRLHSISL